MTATPIDRAAARTLTRAAQAALVVALAAAAAIAAFAGPRQPAPVVLPEPPPGPPAPAGAPAPASIDAAGVVERLSLVQNNPRPPQPVPGGVEPAEHRPAPSAHTPTVRYLGPVGAGAAVYMGLIDDDGKQRFVRVGDRTSGGVVRAMGPADLVLQSEAGVEKRIDLASRGGDVVTKTGALRFVPAARLAPGSPARPGVANGAKAPALSGPEFEARKAVYFNEAIEKLKQTGEYNEEEMKKMADQWADEIVRGQLSVGAASDNKAPPRDIIPPKGNRPSKGDQ